jgi:hypothetical protein
VAFGWGRSDDVVGDLRIGAVAKAGGKGFLYPSIFAGMEGKDGDTTIWVQDGRQGAQKGIQRGKFVVYCDSEGLEDAAKGEIEVIFGRSRQRFADDGNEIRGGRQVMTSRSAGDLRRIGFIGQVLEQVGEVIGRQSGEQFGSRLAAVRVHAHVQGAIEFCGETASRIVELHRGNAEVGEDDVNAGKLCIGKDFGKAGEVGAMSGENIRAKAEGSEASFGFWEFDRIGVEADEATAGLDARQDFLSMAAITERAIDCDFAELWSEDVENFPDHDGAMGAGGCFAGGEDFGDGFGVTLGIVFFVFFLEAARVLAGVARAAAMRSGF